MSRANPSAAAAYQKVGLFLLGLSVLAWAAPVPEDWSLPFRVVLPLVAVAFLCTWIFRRTPASRERAPDVLAEYVQDYFERDGLCFGATLEAADGVCWWKLYCQNRYNRPCGGAVWFVPMEGMAKAPGQPSDVPPLIADVQLNGGEVTLVRFPYAIAAKWQGRLMIYDVAATVEYPSGRGELLRTREGTNVSPPSAQHAEMLKLAGAAMFGLVGIAAIGIADRPKASFEVRLPEGVAEQQPTGVEPRRTILWPADRSSDEEVA